MLPTVSSMHRLFVGSRLWTYPQKTTTSHVVCSFREETSSVTNSLCRQVSRPKPVQKKHQRINKIIRKTTYSLQRLRPSIAASTLLGSSLAAGDIGVVGGFLLRHFGCVWVTVEALENSNGVSIEEARKLDDEREEFRDQEVVVVPSRVVEILNAKEGGWRSERLEEGS